MGRGGGGGGGGIYGPEVVVVDESELDLSLEMASDSGRKSVTQKLLGMSASPSNIAPKVWRWLHLRCKNHPGRARHPGPERS